MHKLTKTRTLTFKISESISVFFITTLKSMALSLIINLKELKTNKKGIVKLTKFEGCYTNKK